MRIQATMFALGLLFCGPRLLSSLMYTPQDKAENLVIIKNTQPGSSLTFDLNQDGQEDIRFVLSGGRWEMLNGSKVLLDPADENGVALLEPNFVIGEDLRELAWGEGEYRLFSFAAARALGQNEPNGSINGTYTIGLALATDEGFQYAWLRFIYSYFVFPDDSQSPPTDLGLLYDFAFEAEFGASIIAPASVPSPENAGVMIFSPQRLTPARS